jgi:hypothetical protein
MAIKKTNIRMIKPYEISNLLWTAKNKPEWLPRTLKILKEREEAQGKEGNYGTPIL